jgi:hypothetical protein
VVLTFLTEAFCVFTQCLNLRLGKVPGSGHLFLPNFFQCIFHPSPIIRGSLVFDEEASLNNPRKNKCNSNVCSISISFVIIHSAKCRQWLTRTPRVSGVMFYSKSKFYFNKILNSSSMFYPVESYTVHGI